MGLNLNKHGRNDLRDVFVRVLTVPERQKFQFELIEAENGAVSANDSLTI